MLREVVKRAARAADRMWKVPPGLVVLIYHRVGGGSGLEVDLDGALFDEQVAFLHSAGAVSLDDGVRSLAGGAWPAERPHEIAVTFDDGTADFVDTALPTLVRYGVPATLYVATQHVDEGVPFPKGGTPLSWAAIRDALSTGLVTIGSHTHRHALLDRLAPWEVVDELDRSIELIGEHTGVAPAHFAYPKALDPSPYADDAVRARFRTAAIAGTRVNAYGTTDLYRLNRSPIQVSDGLRWFEAKAAGGMRLEDSLRRVVNRRRYAGAMS